MTMYRVFAAVLAIGGLMGTPGAKTKKETPLSPTSLQLFLQRVQGQPVAATTHRHTKESPPSVSTVHSAVASSQVSAVTLVSSWMSRRRSRRSATQLR